MKYLIANWKMNLPPEGIDSYLDGLKQLARNGMTTVVAPPFPFLVPIVDGIERRKLPTAVAAQNCSERDPGAFTGEVSAVMVAESGAEYVIVGHSERRALYGEDDAIVGAKLAAAFAAGLRPVLCVGEDLETRETGGALDLLKRQLQGALDALKGAPKALVIAYEPVWAIGTGKNATPEIAAEAHRGIREIVGRHRDRPLELAVIYGGSVNPGNAGDLAAAPEIEGFLVGGASLDSGKFAEIGEALARG